MKSWDGYATLLLIFVIVWLIWGRKFAVKREYTYLEALDAAAGFSAIYVIVMLGKVLFE